MMLPSSASRLVAPWQDPEAVHFPDPITGSLPVILIDMHAFSSLQEMCHGLGWRLNCNRILSRGSAVDHGYFSTYPQLDSKAIDNTTTNLLSDYGLPVNVSSVACHYPLSCLSLYEDRTSPLPVIWYRDKQSLLNHGNQTPLAQACQRDAAYPVVPIIGNA
jgi:hypothetical protein